VLRELPDGFSSLFLASGLRGRTNRVSSSRIWCFFVGVGELVTWMDACPIRWYNFRMRFLGRTACFPWTAMPYSHLRPLRETLSIAARDCDPEWLHQEDGGREYLAQFPTYPIMNTVAYG